MLVNQLTEEDGVVTLRDFNGSYDQIESLTHLLVCLNDCKDPLPVFWDLDEAAAILLKMMPISNIRELVDRTSRDTVLMTESGRFFVRYVPKRMLLISGSRGSVTYYGLGQFFNYDYRTQTPPTLEVQQWFGNEMLNQLFKAGITPKRLTSHASIVDFIFDKINLPTHADCPPEVNQLAWECCGRAWTEAIQLGYWEQAHSYDIVSSFPSQLAGLRDLRYGDWVHSRRYQPSAVYGWLRLNCTVGDDVTPCTYLGKGGLYNARDNYPTVMTKQLYDVEMKYGKFKAEILDGWWWVPNRSPVLPLDIAIRRLYLNRSTTPVLNKLMKTGMVSVYGRLLETHKEGKEYAKTFCPPLASIVEDGIKASVAEFIYKNHLEKNTIHIATDGVVLDTLLPNMQPEAKMGEWRYDGSSPCLVLSTSEMFFKHRRPCQIEINRAIEMIRAKPNTNEWTTKVTRRLSIGECLHDISRVGEITQLPVTFNLPIEHDRKFKPMPRTGKDILSNKFTSTAWSGKELH